MEQDNVETSTGRFYLGEDGINRVFSFPNTNIAEKEAREGVDVAKKVGKGKNPPIFIDISKILSITLEARRIFANEEYANSVALLVNSPLSRVIGNFFLGINKSAVPHKLFTSETEAIEWLKGFLK